eukprot:TRINITY_DN3455_c0_g1_i1.p1 TRINITY_DN3455_c0_g1~~TRINITY_DN3455_c0_g1_i1.p1  ORF type:complete len:259 (-),score=18.29 TRINITY_DN3455_c0_g1_i1:189-965(-)
MSGRVQGKVSLVTGAGGAIGRNITETLAREGSRVYICDLDAAAAAETAAIVGAGHGLVTAHSAAVDVADELAVKAWVDSVAAAEGKIDVLVNNAAAFVFGTVETASSDQWDNVLSVNVKAYAFTSKFVAPFMRKQGAGSIVNVASISSFIAQPAFVPYNTSKGAVLQLTRCMAMDLGIDNIRVNSLCPGCILTPATQKHADSVGKTKEQLVSEMVSHHFLKRMGTTQDIANAALFLASDESSFMTGSSLVVDGGYLAH